MSKKLPGDQALKGVALFLRLFLGVFNKPGLFMSRGCQIATLRSQRRYYLYRGRRMRGTAQFLLII